MRLPALTVAIVLVTGVLLFMLIELQLSWFNERGLRAKGAVEPPDDVIGLMRVAYPGAFMLIVLVRDIDAALVKLKAVGAPVLTRGGMAMTVPGGAHPARPGSAGREAGDPFTPRALDELRGGLPARRHRQLRGDVLARA